MYIKKKVSLVDLNIDLNLPEPINKSLNPIATAAATNHFLPMILVTIFLYLLVVLSKARLKLLWKRLTKLLLCASFSWSCGFNKMAHRAGESVNAFKAEMTIDSAIVTPNSR